MGSQLAADEIRQAVAAYFETRGAGIAAVSLFGSVARGAPREASDVAVAVLFELDPPRTLEGQRVDLAYDLEELLGRDVDLVVLNHASADLAQRVLRDGILVSERNRSAGIAFEVRTRNEYFDLEPILRRYRRAG